MGDAIRRELSYSEIQRKIKNEKYSFEDFQNKYGIPERMLRNHIYELCQRREFASKIIAAIVKNGKIQKTKEDRMARKSTRSARPAVQVKIYDGDENISASASSELEQLVEKRDSLKATMQQIIEDLKGHRATAKTLRDDLTNLENKLADLERERGEILGSIENNDNVIAVLDGRRKEYFAKIGVLDAKISLLSTITLVVTEPPLGKEGDMGIAASNGSALPSDKGWQNLVYDLFTDNRFNFKRSIYSILARCVAIARNAESPVTVKTEIEGFEEAFNILTAAAK